MMDHKNLEKIQAEFLRGASYRTLAKKYGVSFSTLQKYGAREKWTELRKKSHIKTATKIEESVTRRKVQKADRILEAADLLESKILEGIQSGAYVMDATSTRQIMLALKDLKEIRGQKSPLDIREQEARIKKLEREAAGEEEDKTIKVVIDNSLDDYGV